MKALLVTSRVHFVPNNYDTLIVGLAESPHIGGLLILDNLNRRLLKTLLGIIGLGAWRLAWQMLKNMAGGSGRRRRLVFQQRGKPVWELKSINSAAALDLIAREEFDLIINARTRWRYQPEVLRLPPLGCINIHHGLLPEQRGVLCDLWALAAGQAAGFSLHYMTEEIDAGPILSRVPVSDGSDKDFLAYLDRAAPRERHEIEMILDCISAMGTAPTQPNEVLPNTVYRRNPTREQVRQMKANGMRI